MIAAGRGKRAARVAVRATILAGCAAACALLLRARVEASVRPWVAPVGSAIATVGRSVVVGRPLARSEVSPPASSPFATHAASSEPLESDGFATPPAATQAAKPSALSRSTAPRTTARVVPKVTLDGVVHATRKQIDDAVAGHLEGASLGPARDDSGKQIGLALRSVGSLGALGIRPGDVLATANGHSLRTADEAMAALGALGEARRVVVVFKRGAGSFAVVLEVDPS